MIDEQVKDVSTTAIPADSGTDDGTDAAATELEGTAEPVQPSESELRTEFAELKRQLSDINRGMGAGQLKSLQSEIAMLKQRLGETPQKQTKSQDDLLGKYTPDQISESEALIEHLWKKKFGSDWERVQNEQKEQQFERIANTFENAARGYAGKDYETLDPLMTKISSAAYEASRNGDEEAAEFVEVMTKFPKVGARQLVALAREWHSEQVKAKSSQATATQATKGAAFAGKTSGGIQRKSAADDPNTMSIDELRKRVEAGE